MKAELWMTFLVGLLVGVALGWWRATVYARKLRHFNISLDEWAHYDEYTRQARRTKRAVPIYGVDDQP